MRREIRARGAGRSFTIRIFSGSKREMAGAAGPAPTRISKRKRGAMAFTRDKRAMGQVGGAALVLCLLAAPAVAQSPELMNPGEIGEAAPCETVQSGMRVSNRAVFGYFDSGFMVEEYGNESKLNADGDYQNLSVSVPELDSFQGYRVIDCRSGEFLAISASSVAAGQQLAATEFLRSKVQGE